MKTKIRGCYVTSCAGYTEIEVEMIDLVHQLCGDKILQSEKLGVPNELTGNWVTDKQKLSKIEDKVNEICRYLAIKEDK
jgi:hypothetical protein